MKLLKFCAEWCCNCRAIDNFGAEIVDVDKPENASLCAKYNVNALPTFVLETDEGTKILDDPESDTKVKEWLKGNGYNAS